MAKQLTCAGNRLLESLPAAERDRLIGLCTPVDLDFGETLGEPGKAIEYAWFPLGSAISLVAVIDERVNREVGMVGSEGMYGLEPLLGVGNAVLLAVVQGAGQALRIPVETLRREWQANPSLRKPLGLYAGVVLAQTARAAACAGAHVIGARLARWLLMCDDRTVADRFQMTQQYLAYMIGARRASIAHAAKSLQTRQLIAYHRGQIHVADRAGLEGAACSCYQEDIDTYNCLLG